MTQSLESFVKSRTHIFQVESVDTANGRVTITGATVQEQYTLQIPFWGFSIQGLGSSWIRYMPQKNDHVKVAYGIDGTPEIVGYSIFGDEFSPDGTRVSNNAVPHQSAYATLKNFATADPTGFGTIFRELKQGEWDMRSAGGAYILGTRDGTLTLAGSGGASVRLIKNREELQSRANLHIHEANGVEVRWGLVKRSTIPGAAETVPVTPNPGAFFGGVSGSGLASYREFNVSVAYSPAPGAPDLTYYDYAAGTVTNDQGLPVLGIPTLLTAPTALVPFPALPLRSRARWFGIDGLVPMLRVEVDFMGNVLVEQTPLAGGVTGLTVTAARTFLHGQTVATLASSNPIASVFLGSEGALLSTAPTIGALGVPQAFVLGTQWAIADSIMNAAKGIAHTALAANVWPVIGGAVAELGIALAPLQAVPAPPDSVKITVILAALTAFVATLTEPIIAAAAAESSIATVTGEYVTAGGPLGPTHFCSVKVFGE